MSSMVNAYVVLQVLPSADQEVIRAAYRVLARRYHPDHSGDPSDTQRMIELNAAWEILRDPQSRAAYDATLGIERDEPASTRDAPPRPEPEASANVVYAPAASDPRKTRPRRAADDDGSTLDFGRYSGWSIEQVAKADPNYLEWLRRTPPGRRYTTEIERVLEAQRAAEAERARMSWSGSTFEPGGAGTRTWRGRRHHSA